MQVVAATIFVFALLQELTHGEEFGYDGSIDDIVIMAESLQDLQQMLDGLVNSSVRIGLRINLDKTQVMFNKHVTPGPIVVNGGAIKVVREYVYLGQTLQFGPEYWGERYRECAGKHQSPININVLRVKQVTLPDLVLVGFDDSIDNVHVTNNGHTVLIEVKNEPHPRVRGGPLDGDYIFSQLHFHWGDNDTFGSEDKINHRSFPMELHMVFFKEEYQSATEAVKHSDGLTVLAFFYELDRHQHPAYDDITSALVNVTEPHTSVVMSHPFSFLNILPYDLKRYFTYKGSLTTPPCSEVVTWLDFEQPIRLTHEQIEAFREIRSSHGKITHNFRPIQPIGDRVVFYNIDNNYYVYNEIDDHEETTTVKPSRRKKGRNNAHIMVPTVLYTISLTLMMLFSL